MLDAIDFLNAVKKAAIDAIEASYPSDFCFGKVVSLSPLKVNVEQRLTLTKMQLVMTETVVKTSPIEVGDEIVLLRKKGGQKYLIIDKVVNP